MTYKCSFKLHLQSLSWNAIFKPQLWLSLAQLSPSLLLHIGVQYNVVLRNFHFGKLFYKSNSFTFLYLYTYAVHPNRSIIQSLDFTISPVVRSAMQLAGWSVCSIYFRSFYRTISLTPGDRTRLTWLHTFSHRFGQLRSQSSKHLCSTISKKYTLLEHQQTLRTLTLLLSFYKISGSLIIHFWHWSDMKQAPGPTRTFRYHIAQLLKLKSF